MADTVELADPGSRGQLHVRDRAVEHIAIAAAHLAGTCRSRHGLSGIAGRELPRAKVDVINGRVRIEIEIAVEWGRPLGAVATAVREQVADALATQSGLIVDRVSVHVAAIETTDRRRAQ